MQEHGILPIAACTVAIVAGLRKHWPAVDGKIVYVFAFVVAVGVAFAMRSTLMPPWASEALWGFAVAVGGVAFLRGEMRKMADKLTGGDEKRDDK